MDILDLQVICSTALRCYPYRLNVRNLTSSFKELSASWLESSVKWRCVYLPIDFKYSPFTESGYLPEPRRILLVILH